MRIKRTQSGIVLVATEDIKALVRIKVGELGAGIISEIERHEDAARNLAATNQDKQMSRVSSSVLRKDGLPWTIYQHCSNSGGAIIDEVELATEALHQTVGPLFRYLALAGLIRDSGRRRENQRGFECIVWEAVPVQEYLRARIAANPLVSDMRDDSVCNCGQPRRECRCEADDAERYGKEEDGDE